VANLNRIILVGNLTADPETRFSMDGLSMCKFTLCVSSYQGAKKADQINVVAWRKLAEICGQILKKDSLALIEGRIQVRSYEDKSGQRKWVTEVVANNMQRLDARPKQTLPEVPIGAETKAAGEDQDASGFEEVEELSEEDLPF